MPGDVTVTVTLDRRVIMHRIADSMSDLDFSLRWGYVYSEKIDAITGAWFRVPIDLP